MASTDPDDALFGHIDIDVVAPGHPAEGAVQIVSGIASPLPADGVSITREHAAQIVAIGSAARRMGVSVDVSAAIARAIDPGALRLAVLDAAAARDESLAIVSTAPTPASVGTAIEPAGRRESPLLSEARRSAAEPRR